MYDRGGAVDHRGSIGMSEVSIRKVPTMGTWLAEDKRRAREEFARRSDTDFGTADMPISRYISPEFHQQEMSRLWPYTWQMACHETNIPEPGDYTSYEIGPRAYLIVRVDKTTIKAYPNACLHRGMQLLDGSGRTATLSCRFHGWTWNLDGSLRSIPERWDFPQTQQRSMTLPEARVAIWGGFVFINPDPNAEAFETFVGELPQHFKSAPLEDRTIAVHVSRVMPANWKVTMEAFIESYHVSPTHPQSVAVSQYAETQYDTYGPNVSRLATVSIAPATKAMRDMSPQAFADMAAKGTGRERVQLKEGQTYRQALAEQRRAEVEKVQGRSVEHLTDVEMLDAIQYFLFPNFMPWYGFGLPIVYRFRPNGDRYDSSLMDIYVLAPRDLNKPPIPAAKHITLPEDQPFSDCAVLGRLGPIFDQDYVNIAAVWKGLQSTVQKGIILGQYQESRIRHYHQRIDTFLANAHTNESHE